MTDFFKSAQLKAQTYQQQKWLQNLLAEHEAEIIQKAAQIALTYRDEADNGKHPDIGDPIHSLGQGYAANVIAKRIFSLSKENEMNPSREAIIEELKSRIEYEKENVKESSDDIRTPGFNQNLGAKDALESLLDWIEEEINNDYRTSQMKERE